MILLPAIDVLGGKAVRLEQGDFDRETVYDEDPAAAARSWTAAGARFLHVVDLDGAREGEPVNLDHLRRIAGEVSVPIQYGGGLRNEAAVAEAIAAGADRVVLGTAVQTDLELLAAVLRRFGPRIVVAVDVRGGQVATGGWTKASGLTASNVLERMQRHRVTQFVYTNADRDGMLSGPDLREVRRIAGAIRGRFLYSGGVASLDDLRALRALRLVNLAGVISGRALYEGRFSVADAQEALLDPARPHGSHWRAAAAWRTF